MPNEGRPQDFELIELLISEAVSITGAGNINPTQPGNEFKSFEARFQSYIDQVPSYLHSVSKGGFFPHFFLGSFSTLIGRKIAGKEIKKVYYKFDGPKTLKVAVIRDEGNEQKYKGYGTYQVNLSLFMIFQSDNANKKFTYGELESVLNQLNFPAQGQYIKDAIGQLQVRSVEVTKIKGEMSIEVKNEKLDRDASTAGLFWEVGQVWKNPKNDIAKLTNSDGEEVKKSLKKILKKVSKIHSECKDSLVYGKEERVSSSGHKQVVELREAAHHGFIAGALVMNFRYRPNLRVYLEQFAGRGFADIVLVPRGDDRSLNAIPIIIELKAGTGIGTTPDDALEQAKGYARGFQPNVMRVLTTADDSAP